MERTCAIALHDILQTIDAVAEMVTDLDLDSFRADYRTQRAVERCIEIASEAS